MVELDKDDIQGNVLYGYQLPWVAHAFSSIENRRIGEWKQLFGRFSAKVTRATERVRADATEPTLNVGLSYEGLAKLYPHQQSALSLRFQAFVEGMAKRSKLLGDPPSIDFGPWNARHVWISVYGQDEAQIKSHLREITKLVEGLDLARDVLWGSAIEREGKRFEHFGFRDGIVSPAIDGAYEGADRLIGNGKLDDHGNWLPIAPGEFILGHPNERGELPLADLPAELRALLENGTFAVFRDLEQHVSEFRDYVEQKTQQTGENVAAKMMGRKPDGESLARPGEHVNFTYDDDAGGARCPLGAHVRRTNPRKPGLGLHRLIRRGMPYQFRTESSNRCGIYFVAMNASIESQFEFLQKAWINGSTGGLSASKDPVASQKGPRKMLIEGSGTRAPILLLDIPQFVTCHGGQYYFLPGRRALALLGSPAAKDTRGANGSIPVRRGGSAS